MIVTAVIFRWQYGDHEAENIDNAAVVISSIAEKLGPEVDGRKLPSALPHREKMDSLFICTSLEQDKRKPNGTRRF